MGLRVFLSQGFSTGTTLSREYVGINVGIKDLIVGIQLGCWYITEMPLSDSEVRLIKAGDRHQTVSAGNSLYIQVYPESKGGRKYFFGRMRFPPGTHGKQVDVRIGPYGKGVDKWTLKQARDEWDRIRTWSREDGRDPRELKREQKQQGEEKGRGPTFKHLVDAYLAWGATKKPKPM